MEVGSYRKFNDGSDFCVQGEIGDPRYFVSARLGAEPVDSSSTATVPITLVYYKIDVNGNYQGEEAPPDVITWDAASSTCSNFVTSIELIYDVLDTAVISSATINVYWRESFVFQNTWFKFVYNIIPKPPADPESTTNLVYSSGSIGYNFGDYVPFGQVTTSTSKQFLGVRVQTPVTSFRFKDLQGNCLIDNTDNPPYSEEVDFLKVGHSKLYSCKIEISQANQMRDFCNTLTIQSNLGVN